MTSLQQYNCNVRWYSISMKYFLILFFLSSLSLVAQEQPIKIYDRKTDDAIKVYADNDELFPFTLTLKIDYQGLVPKEKLPDYIVLPGNSKKFLLAELKIPENTSWKISYGFQYMEGNADAIHDDDFVYQLPFAIGNSFPLTQGYNGPSTHQGINALDFTMAVGEDIVAARGGTVVKIKEDSNRGCPSSRCLDDGNFVRILHDDGTMAEYYHLQKNGALVNPGDVVKQGQLIGKSGDTGFASGPHLHFLVFKTDGVKQITIKTKFKYESNRIGFLKVGEIYTAFK